MFDIVASNSGDLVHRLIHSRDDLLQEIRLLANYLVCDNVRERQNAFQPVQKTNWYLAVLGLYLQKLNGQELHLLLIGP